MKKRITLVFAAMLFALAALLALPGLFKSQDNTARAQAVPSACFEWDENLDNVSSMIGVPVSRLSIVSASPNGGYAYGIKFDIDAPIEVFVPSAGLNGHEWRLDSDSPDGSSIFGGPDGTLVHDVRVGTLWQDAFPIVCSSMSLAGPVEVAANASVNYTTAFTPLLPLSPVSYTWAIEGNPVFTGEGSAVAVNWSEPGTYVVEVTADWSNIQQMQSLEVVVGEPYTYPVCVEFPLTPSQSILAFGKNTGLTDWEIFANGDGGYAWSFSSPGDPELINVPAGYRFDWDGGPSVTGPGTAENAQYGTMWQLETISCRELTLSGPMTATVGTPLSYTLSLSPTTAFTTTWEVSGSPVLTVTDTTAEVVWDAPGTFTVAATSHYNNVVLTEQLTVEVSSDVKTYTLFLPVVRNDPPAPPALLTTPLNPANCDDINPNVVFSVSGQWERIGDCGFRLDNYTDVINLTVQPGSEAHTTSGVIQGPQVLYNFSGALSIWVVGDGLGGVTPFFIRARH